MMTAKSRRTVTTIETLEVWITGGRVTRPGKVLCPECPNQVVMVTPQEAARTVGVSQRTVYRWVEDGRVHFAETTDGSLYVCLAAFL